MAVKRYASCSPGERLQPKKSRNDATSTHAMLTRGITAAIARNAVLQTQELLEAVLLHVPPMDLMTFRSISKQFQMTIDTSPKLQTKMFLRASKLSRRWILDKVTNELRPYANGESERLGERRVGQLSLTRPRSLNPLLFTTEHEARRPPLKHRAQICEGLRLTQRPNLSRTKNDSIHHRMFVCQPPVPRVECLVNYNPNKSSRRVAPDGWHYWDASFRIRVRNDAGVTFGDLMHAIRTLIAKTVPESFPSSNFRVHVSDSKQRFMSRFWMLGAIFADECEKAEIEDLVKLPDDLSPLAAKMGRPEYLRDVEKERSGMMWSEGDFYYADHFEEIQAALEDDEDIREDYDAATAKKKGGDT